MRKPTKPTDLQKKLFQMVGEEIVFKSNTNDLDSPTHYSDIDNFLNAYDIHVTIKNRISQKVKDIFTLIKSVEDGTT